MIYSPIFYTGNKTKLIKKGLIDLFPKNINKFIDVFTGSGVVALNTKANEYILNDINSYVIELLQMFLKHEPQDIIKNIELIINKFQLEYGIDDNISFDSRSKKFNKEIYEIHKENYTKLRNYYNTNKNTLFLYVLLIYSFSHQMRFSNKGEFNMPCGHDKFTKTNRKWILDFPQDFKPQLLNKDFRQLDYNLSSSDFVYLDPPYFNSTATYNENNAWSLQDENDLFALCENLDSRGIKFGISNVFRIRGKENTHLIKWCKKNNWKVHYFDKMVYSTNGRGNAKAQEVYIYNY